MPKKDPRRCRNARIGGTITAGLAAGLAGGSVGPDIGVAISSSIGPGVIVAAITVVSIALGAIGGFLAADGTADACSDDDSGKKNERSARIGFIILGIPFGASIAVKVLELMPGPDSSYTFEIALAGALAGAIAGDLIRRRVRMSG